MEIIINVIAIIVILPLVTLLHEFGHVLFIKLFRGRIKEITFGLGETFKKFGIFHIKTKKILYGRVHYDIANTTFISLILISSGGIIVNLFTGTLTWVLVSMKFIDPNNFIRFFIIYSFLLSIYTLIPQKYQDGHVSDGGHIFKQIKNISN